MTIFLRTGRKLKGLKLKVAKSASKESEDDSDASGESDDSSSSSSSSSSASSIGKSSATTATSVVEEEDIQIHTQLTTINAIKWWRDEKMCMMTILIKVMPTGFVTKLRISAEDSLFHLNNAYDSHCRFGNSNSRMIVLPTSTGIYELTGNISLENENLMEDYGGRCKVGRFGLNKKNAVIVLFSFARYIPRNTQQLMSWYLMKNAKYDTGDGIATKNAQLVRELPVYDTDQQAHKDVPNDPVQKELVRLVSYEYYLGQLDQKHEYEARGLAYQSSEEVRKAAIMKERHEKKLAEEKLLRAEERRLESQLNALGVDGAEREAAMHALEARAAKKKGIISEEEKQAMLDHQERHRARMEKITERRHMRQYVEMGGNLDDIEQYEAMRAEFIKSEKKEKLLDEDEGIITPGLHEDEDNEENDNESAEKKKGSNNKADLSVSSDEYSGSSGRFAEDEKSTDHSLSDCNSSGVFSRLSPLRSILRTSNSRRGSSSTGTGNANGFISDSSSSLNSDDIHIAVKKTQFATGTKAPVSGIGIAIQEDDDMLYSISSSETLSLSHTTDSKSSKPLIPSLDLGTNGPNDLPPKRKVSFSSNVAESSQPISSNVSITSALSSSSELQGIHPPHEIPRPKRKEKEKKVKETTKPKKLDPRKMRMEKKLHGGIAGNDSPQDHTETPTPIESPTKEPEGATSFHESKIEFKPHVTVVDVTSVSLESYLVNTKASIVPREKVHIKLHQASDEMMVEKPAPIYDPKRAELSTPCDLSSVSVASSMSGVYVPGHSLSIPNTANMLSTSSTRNIRADISSSSSVDTDSTSLSYHSKSSVSTVANKSLISQLMQARAAYLDQEYLNATPLRREVYDLYDYPDHTPNQSQGHNPGGAVLPSMGLMQDDGSHSTWDTATSIGPQTSISNLSQGPMGAMFPSDMSHNSSLGSHTGDDHTDASIESKFSNG